jgi:hypothetical protein
LLVRYPQRKKYCDWGHSFQWILKCQRNINWVTTTESLFLKNVSTANARCYTDQRSMATEMLWVSLEERSGTNSPRQRFHSQLFCKIVRYFCRTLYEMVRIWKKSVISHYTIISLQAVRRNTTSVTLHSPEITPLPAQHKAEVQAIAWELRFFIISPLALTMFISCN